MSEQLWSIEAVISASFFLVSVDQSSFEIQPYPNLKSFKLIPEFDTNDKQTGVFNIKIEFIVQDDDVAKLEPNIIADLARDILDHYINLIVFLTSNVVKKLKPVTLKYEYPEGGKFRNIIFDPEIVNLIPPVPLLQTSLFKTKIESNLTRCLAYYKYAIQERDVLISISFLMSALDMVANQFNIDSKIVSKCDQCGFEKEIGLGSKAKVKYVITTIGQLSTEDFDSIWSLRNSIFHGYFSINAKNIRELYAKRSIVRIVLIKAIKKLIDLKEEDLPLENNKFSFADPILSFDTVPDSQKNTPTIKNQFF
jgi:hypothetical protein